MRENKRKGIICFDASKHGLNQAGGVAAPPHLLAQCSNDGFGQDSNGARVTKAGGLGVTTMCKQNSECSHDGFARIHMVFEASLHGLKERGGGWEGRNTTLAGWFWSGIIRFEPKKAGGLLGGAALPPPPQLQTQCSNDGFGKDSDGARLTKARAWGFGPMCKQKARTMGLAGIHTVLEGSLHGLKGPICKHNARTIDLEGNHML